MAALDTARLRASDRLLPVVAGLAVAGGGLAVGAGAAIQPKAAVGLAVAVVFAFVVFQDLAAGVALFAFAVFLVQIPGLSSQGTTSAKLIGGLLALSWALKLI